MEAGSFNNEFISDEAIKNLLEADDEGLERIKRIAERHAAEINEWQLIIKQEIEKRRAIRPDSGHLELERTVLRSIYQA